MSRRSHSVPDHAEPPTSLVDVDRASAASRISRRALLHRAAFGASALAFAPSQAWAGEKRHSSSTMTPVIDAFEGRLIGKSRDALFVERWSSPVRVPVTPTTELWRGIDTSLGSFLEGDQVLVRTVDGLLTNAWANLVKVRGQITGQTSHGYEVTDEKMHSRVELVVDGGTKLRDAVTGSSVLLPALPVDTWVDAAGLRTDGGVIASNASYALPGSQNVVDLGKIDVTFSTDGPLVSFEYRQMASWFDCPNGAGRCRTCNTSNSGQLAWPALDTCGCCSPTCCDCAKNCLAQVYLSCGSGMIVADPCNPTVQAACVVVDCGPCNNKTCHTKCTTTTCTHTCTECGVTRPTPVVDLTKPTFTIFRNPASFGCMLANVKN
jgi:hypothetical protein